VSAFWFANRKCRATFAGCLRFGFSPGTPNELDQLREAYRSLSDITRNLASAQKCLKKEDMRMAEHQLRAAEWRGASEAENSGSGAIKSQAVSHATKEPNTEPCIRRYIAV
jgi:hypothetical protein